jgi:type I site-specific restriction endonuclease
MRRLGRNDADPRRGQLHEGTHHRQWESSSLAAKPSAPITSLYYKSNIPIAIIEAKDNNHCVASGMQQALDYAVTLNIPFVFSSNGDGFVFHDRVELCRADAERRFVPRAASIAASSSNEGTRSCPGRR